MNEVESQIETYVDRVKFPVTKEELINGLLAENAEGEMVELVERLPSDNYDSVERLRADLEAIDRVPIEEVSRARTYNDFLYLVERHVGDIRYATKQRYNEVVAEIIADARQQGVLDASQSRDMETRLEAGYAELREPMSEVSDNDYPVDPRKDLPQMKE